MTAVPWLLPGLLIAVIVSLVAGSRVGRQLGTGPVVGGATLLCLGLILSSTLTPQVTALEFGAQSGGTCDLTLSLPWLGQLPDPVDSGLNILLLLPLGFTLGLVSRPFWRVALVGGALALPLIVEWTQLVVPALDRACQIDDVAANEIGLILGVTFGSAVRRLRQRRTGAHAS